MFYPTAGSKQSAADVWILQEIVFVLDCSQLFYTTLLFWINLTDLSAGELFPGNQTHGNFEMHTS